jgi:hypothetical protein
MHVEENLEIIKKGEEEFKKLEKRARILDPSVNVSYIMKRKQ